MDGISPVPASDRLKELWAARDRAREREERAGWPVSPVSPGAGVAPRGKSRQRPIRIPDETWYDAVDRAKEEGIPIGRVVTALLELYADGDIDV